MNFNRHKPYSNAAFSHALEQDQLIQWQKMFCLVKDLMAQKTVLNFRKNYKQDKIANLICAILKDDLDPYFCRFLQVLSEEKMLFELPTIYDFFLKKWSEHNKVMVVKLTSARKIKAEILDELKQRLKNKYSLSDIEFIENIEEQLIGGIVIRIDDQIIDGSVKHLLEPMHEINL